MRSLINHLLARFMLIAFSLGAGEAEDGDEIESAPQEAEDGDSFFDEEDEDGADDEGNVSDVEDEESEDEESDDEESEDEEEDAESEDEDAESEGDGGEEDGVDSVAAMSIRRNWETRFETGGRHRTVDPVQAVRSRDLPVSDELRTKVTKLFEEEKDIEAIIEVVRDAVPQMIGAYDESRVAPVVDAATLTSRNQRLIAAVEDFDTKYPGAREGRNERMAELYDEFKEKYGYQYADTVPVEDYFVMAGGTLKTPKAKAKPKSKAKERAQAAKSAAVKATRKPDRIAKARSSKSRKRGAQSEVDDTYEAVRRTRFDPFTMG